MGFYFAQRIHMKADELVVQFKVDDAELKKGYQELDRSNDKMEKSLEDIEKKAEVTADKLFALGKKVVGFIAAAVVANQTIGQAIEEAREITRLDSFSNAISSSIEDVNALNNSIISLGGDKETAEANTQAIFDAISEGARDSESEFAKSFKKIGVSIKDTNGEARDLFETMGDLSESISRMDERKAREFMKALGITDRATLELMMKGRAEFEQMIKVQKEASPINEESARKSVEFTKALNRLQLEFKNIKTSAFTSLMPAMTWIVEKFETTVKWMRQNKPFVLGFFGAIATGLTLFYLPAVIKAAVATWALVAPILAVAAPFLLLAGIVALAISEMHAFWNGNDNLISRLLNANPKLKKWSDDFSMYVGDAIDFAKLDFKAAQDRFSIFINDFIEMSISKITKWKDDFSTLFGDAIDAAIESFKGLKSAYAEHVQPLIDSVNTGILDRVMKGRDAQAEINNTIPVDENGVPTVYPDANGNLHPKELEPFEEPRIRDSFSFLNPKSMQLLSNEAQNIKESISSPLMQDKNALMSSIAMTGKVGDSRKEVRIDSIQINLPAGDVESMTRNLEQAVNKVLGEQFDDVLVQSSTSIV